MELKASFPWRTERVELFLMEPGYVTERYVGWLQDREVTRFLESRFKAHDLASIRGFVAKMREDADVLMLGIRSLRLDAHVGNIKLGPIDRNHRLGDLGLLIGERSAWGQGLATDAITVMTSIAERQLGLRKLTAGCYGSNVGSVRAFIKAGFHVEATLKDHFVVDGDSEDMVLMARHRISHAPAGSRS